MRYNNKVRNMNHRSNFGAINEMRKYLGETRKLTMESFIMPESEDYEGDMEYGEEGMDVVAEPEMQTAAPEAAPVETPESKINGIENELTQIRKIALSVINRLADQPTSPQYDTMKRIWNLVDRAIDVKTGSAE